MPIFETENHLLHTLHNDELPLSDLKQLLYSDPKEQEALKKRQIKQIPGSEGSFPFYVA